MHRYYLQILIAFLTLSGHAFWCVKPAEGSWFDGMDFEDYHPRAQQDESDKKGLSLSQQNAWRIPCGLIREGSDPSIASNIAPLSTVVDKELSSSTIREEFLKSNFSKDDLSKLLVQDPLNGTQMIDGLIWLRMGSTEATVLPPTLQVVKDNSDDNVDLRLGMDFLSMYQGKFDVEGEGGLRIVLMEGAEVLIPIWQPRSSIEHEDL